MESTNTAEIISAIAAIFSAIATVMAWLVARKTYKLNTSLTIYKSELKVLDELIEKLVVLKTLRKAHPISIPDDEFINIPKLLSDLKDNIDAISSMNKKIESDLQHWSTKEEGKLLILITSQNPWSDMSQTNSDFLELNIDYFKGERARYI